MKKAINLPVDGDGNAIPVGYFDTAKTAVLTCTEASTVYAQTIPLAKTEETMASLTLDCSGADTITFTSLIKGWESENISITVAAAGTFGIAISGKAITITPAAAGTKCSTIEEAIAANPMLAELVEVSYTDEDATIDAEQSKAFLSGWDSGDSPIYVRATMDNDGFIGIGNEAIAGTPAASMPIAGGISMDIMLLPGQLVSAKSATAGAKLYLTPGKKW